MNPNPRSFQSLNRPPQQRPLGTPTYQPKKSSPLVPIVLLIAVAAGGYLLFPYLTEPRNAAKGDASVRKVIINGLTIEVDFASLAPEVIPAEVTMMKDVLVSTLDDDPQMVSMLRGQTAVLVEVQGERLILQVPSGDGMVVVEHADTNFESLVAENMLKRAASLAGLKKSESVVNAPVVVIEDKPVVATNPDDVLVPERDVAEKPDQLDDETLVERMKDSVKQGEVRELLANQILGWKANGTEQIDGRTYQIGLVAYEAETLFGTQKFIARALFYEGSIHRWICDQSMMDIP